MSMQLFQKKRRISGKLEDALHQSRAKIADKYKENCQRPLRYHKPEDVVFLRFRKFLITAQ